MDDLELDNVKDIEDCKIRGIYYPCGVLNEAIIEVINNILKLARGLANIVYDEDKSECDKAKCARYEMLEHKKLMEASLKFLSKGC